MDTLLVILGPTGVGKTELSLRLAEHYGCPIVSADSRQIYSELPIGTAAPTAEEQQRVTHYFIGTKRLAEEYNAGQYERDCLQLLDQLRRQTALPNTPFALLTGGSMMYIDAVCKGLDDIPNVPSAVRNKVTEDYRTNGLEWLQREVERLDPCYWAEVDKQNPQRLMHCVEICLTTGKPYSVFRRRTHGGEGAERNFRIVKIGLRRPKEELYERINRRVEAMMGQGLEEEAYRAYESLPTDDNGQKKVPNSLNTVGYKELFRYFEGEWTKEYAMAMIQQNTRHYAKRQMTWFRRDKDIDWLEINDDYEKQIHTIDTLVTDTYRL